MGESRIENILEATIAGEPYTEEPQSRIEKDLLDLKEAIEQGGGTSDYSDLENKPKINNVELDGNKSFADLGLPNPMHIAGRVDTVSELPQTATVGDVYLVGLVNADKDEYVYTASGWEFLGSSTATDYSDLTNKPSINNVPLSGNKTSADLGLVGAGGTNYFEYNGIRIYVSATEPTGTIPDGSIWIGSGAALVIDSILNTQSTNPIQNQAVANAIGDVNTVLEGVL